jgi:LysM repeat protein
MLAALALVAGAIVLIVVIASSLGGSESGSSPSGGGGHHHGPRDKYYVVQPGDTFGGIAQKEGVPIGRLERLNPNLDTQVLPENGCVDLVPQGCKILAQGG